MMFVLILFKINSTAALPWACKVEKDTSVTVAGGRGGVGGGEVGEMQSSEGGGPRGEKGAGDSGGATHRGGRGDKNEME